MSVSFDEMTAVDAATPTRAPLSKVEAIMFVVDQVHTPLGADGRVWIDDVRYVRSAGLTER